MRFLKRFLTPSLKNKITTHRDPEVNKNYDPLASNLPQNAYICNIEVVAVDRRN